jgi:type I restriction enzyme M protein
MAKIKRAESRARYFIRHQAQKRGWNVAHIGRGGDVLEEQEIVDFFPDIGLGLSRPDFLFSISGEPSLVVEAKNDPTKISKAISEAIEYAEAINATGKYKVNIAVGAAGEENHGFNVEVRYLKGKTWKPLLSNGYEITAFPSKREVELAINADDATTKVDVPSITEFIDAAIELSRILRLAKVEAPLRPRVIGSLTLAMYQGDVDTTHDNALASTNKLLAAAIDESVDLTEPKKKRLKESLHLLGGDYDRLAPFIGRIVALLNQLNIRSVLQTDTDFLGLFYEAFLRYGYDNNALGIVFTPRHITTFCVDLIGAKATDRVIDIACGTGGFLVAAFDAMMKTAHGPKAIHKVKNSLYGFDTNPTIWALSTLNMFFRGDGKSHIENNSCFEKVNKHEIEGKFTRAFLNPPFSQDGEPERDFIDLSMDALEPEMLLAVVVKAGIFADEEHGYWRKEFTRNHTVLGVISLPEDLFYPTAAPTSILIAKAHIPQGRKTKVFMSRISNDGFEKLKGRRVAIEGSQLQSTTNAFHDFLAGNSIHEKNVAVIDGEKILEGNEWSPQQWLFQPIEHEDELKGYEQEVRLSLYRAISAIPDLADVCLPEFPNLSDELPELPYAETQPISFFFDVQNGRSTGEKNFREGIYPYISSGDTTNSIIRLIEPDDDNELFDAGGITVTAFGQGYLQPWPFVARGNGGSSVRVLIPKFLMTLHELTWFVAQINAQRWRFFYARMAIKSRLERLEVTSPPHKLKAQGTSLHERAKEFKENLLKLSLHN